MSEKHQECSECGKPLAHRIHSPTYGTHAYREPVASPQATEPPINLSPVAEYWAEYHNRPIEEADTDELLFAHNWAQRGIGREDAGSPAERQQPSKLHNEGSSPSSPSNSNINIALHRAAQPAAGTTPQAERSGGPLCDNCGKAVKQHYCWADSNPCGVSTYHPSEARAVAPVETPDTHLPCGHSKWDSRRDCIMCLQFAVDELNKRLAICEGGKS